MPIKYFDTKNIVWALFFSLVSLQVKAQEKFPMGYKHAVTLNGTNLLSKHLGLEYEFAVREHFSFSLGVRYRPMLNFGSMNSVFIRDFRDIRETYVTGSRYKSWSFQPQFKFYPRRYLQGFYTEAYLRWRKTPFQVNLLLFDQEKDFYSQETIRGSWNAFSGGFAIGNHWAYRNRMCLDITWIGLHYGMNDLSVFWNASGNLTQEQINDTNAEILFYTEDLIFGNIHFQTNNKGFDYQKTFNALGLRLFSIKFGYTFY